MRTDCERLGALCLAERENHFDPVGPGGRRGDVLDVIVRS